MDMFVAFLNRFQGALANLSEM